MFAGALIVYSVTKVPYEMAFKPAYLETDAVAICDLFVDFCFFVDMYATRSPPQPLARSGLCVRYVRFATTFVHDSCSARPQSRPFTLQGT